MALTVPKIIMTLKVPGDAEERLRQLAEVTVLGEVLPAGEYRKAVAGADALLCQLRDRIDEELLEAAGPQLKVVSNYAVGLDNIDLAACTKHSVFVGHTPEVLTDATADLCLTLLLAAARRVVEGDQQMRQGAYPGWSPFYMLGSEVTGATLGLVGYGRIGRAVARRAQLGFRMRVLAYDPGPAALDDELEVERCSLERVLQESDFISCHVPLTDQTRHLLGEAEFSQMKRTAIVINTSRGPVLDEQALVVALRSGEIAGAGLDVYEREPEMAPGLAQCHNAVLLPHLGSATWQTRAQMGAAAAENIISVLDGGRPRYWANPELGAR